MARLGEFTANDLDDLQTTKVNNYLHNSLQNNVAISTENMPDLLMGMRIF